MSIYDVDISDPETTAADVIAAVDGEGPDDVACHLACSNQWRLLEQLLDHDLYGEEAQKELDIHRRMEEGLKQFEAKCAKYPEPLKRFRRIVQASTQLGNWDINYPSAHAIQNKMGENFFAISGDGLFVFMIEVVTFQGAGQYKLHRNPVVDYVGDHEQHFVEVTGGKHERPLTEDMVADALMQVYDVQEEPSG